MNKIQYDWGTKRYYWIDETGKEHTDINPFFVVVAVINAIIDELNQKTT